MTSFNVEEWTANDVADWISGLEPTVARYVPLLRQRGLDGRRLLILRCDDLEYLGMRKIGHQELLLAAADQLRNFHFESRRECVQQLALRVSVVAGALARTLAAPPDPAHPAHPAARLLTQTLADVAAFVSAVKPLVSWLDSCTVGGGGGGRRAALLRAALEAATCAQRDRFAEQPAPTIRAAAAAAAALADQLLHDIPDPTVLQPAAAETVPAAHLALRAGDQLVRLGGRVVVGWAEASLRRVLADAGGAAAASVRRRGRAVPAGPQTNQPNRLYHYRRPFDQRDFYAFKREFGLFRDHTLSPKEHKTQENGVTILEEKNETQTGEAMGGSVTATADESDDSEGLSPPASPDHLHTRMFPRKPLVLLQRRHSVGAPAAAAAPATHHLAHFWQELKNQKWLKHTGSATAVPSCPLAAPPRPSTCLGAPEPCLLDDDSPKNRGKLDKSHSTPAYDFNTCDEPAAVPQTIPESPCTPDENSPTILVHSAEKADQILDFKKSSTKIEVAIQKKCVNGEDTRFTFDNSVEDVDKVLETINIAMVEHQKDKPPKMQSQDGVKYMSEHVKTIQDEIVQAISAKHSEVPPEPPPRPAKPVVKEPIDKRLLKDFPTLKIVKQPDSPDHREYSPLKPMKYGEPLSISMPLKHITKHDIQMICHERWELPPLNCESPLLASSGDLRRAGKEVKPVTSPTTSAVRGMFPSKTKGLKKKNSILVKRRGVPAAAAECEAILTGGVLVRGRGGNKGTWQPRHAVLTEHALLIYKAEQSRRADCLMFLWGATAAAAPEVRSRPYALKVYLPARAIYLAVESRAALALWLAKLTRATAPCPQSPMEEEKQFSETDHSDEEGDGKSEGSSSSHGKDKDKDKDKDKSKFNSLKKLTHRMQRSSSQEAVCAAAGGGVSTSLDRKYLRFFTRHRNQHKPKSKSPTTPVPTEHYRSYRRAPAALSLSPPTLERDRATSPRPAHASNPNLLELTSTAVPPPPPPRPAPKPAHKPDYLLGFVTLEEFMLKKQEEERRQVYTNRVLMGIERDRKESAASSKKAAKELQKQLDKIVPDVIYGELPPNEDVTALQGRVLPTTPEKPDKTVQPDGIPISVPGKDGYEKIVYTSDGSRKNSLNTAKELGYEVIYDDTPPKVLPKPKLVQSKSPPSRSDAPAGLASPTDGPEKFWLNSLKRNDKVVAARAGGARSPPAHPAHPAHPAPRHDSSWSGAAGAAAAAAAAECSPSVSRLLGVFSARGPAANDTESFKVKLGTLEKARYAHLQCPPTFEPETYSLARPPHHS